ncbi:hypothetical protein SCALM49S_01943 [Streptomyces californicus]
MSKPAPPVRAASSASYRVAGGWSPGSELSVYQASVLHSSVPSAELKGRGERRWTTRFGLSPGMVSVTFFRSSESAAALTPRDSSSTLGPP